MFVLYVATQKSIGQKVKIKGNQLISELIFELSWYLWLFIKPGTHEQGTE